MDKDYLILDLMIYFYILCKYSQHTPLHSLSHTGSYYDQADQVTLTTKNSPCTLNIAINHTRDKKSLSRI